jgi:3-methyladenine DNA glycosylase/8-oxoguanine DNA glycosylase
VREAVWRPDWPVDVARTLGPLRRGGRDPSFRRDPDGVWWHTTTTPEGPATVAFRVDREGVHHAAWGSGTDWVMDTVPGWLGAADDRSDFRPTDPIVVRLDHRFPGLRLGRTNRIWDALVAAIIEQKVTSVEAHQAWRSLLLTAGDPAPGPVGERMRVPPTPEALLALTDWQWHRCGMDGQRRRTLRAAATVAQRLEAGVGMSAPDASKRLQVVPGVGVWTAAETMQRACGDPDAVSVGDYHVPSLVGWALIGERIDDERMLELLEPFRPHRQRIVRLIECGAPRPPRRGPRAPIRSYRSI